jgi:DNA-directed RNA polymerase specialized sigma24 family protein
MARVAEIDQMLRNWAEFRGSGGSRDASVDDIAAAVAALPADLRTTLEEVYSGRGSPADHCRRLGWPESTIARRIGRAHLLLVDLLALQRAERRRDDERAKMRC